MGEKGKALLCGALAGFANGFFGAGGGLFLVPLFIRWLKMPEQKAFATSVFVILPLSIVSVILYAIAGDLSIAEAWPYCIGGLCGGFIAGRFLKKVNTTVLRRIFGGLLIYGGVRMVFFL